MGFGERALVLLACAVVLSAGQGEEELREDARRIDFSSRGIMEVTTDFSGFTELEEIDYSNNDITVIKPDIFRDNLKLKYIDLSGNGNLEFPASGPFLYTHAKIVNLSSCHIETIPGNALDEMRKLDVLDLTHNNINFETSLAFQNMQYPPRKMIVSEISSEDLQLICKNVDMIVVVKQNGRKTSRTCRDVRNKHMHGEMRKSPKSETTSNEDYDVDLTIIEENLLKVDGTHMEMLSDQPDEGSGFGDESELETTASEEKTEHENVFSLEIPDGTSENAESNEESEANTSTEEQSARSENTEEDATASEHSPEATSLTDKTSGESTVHTTSSESAAHTTSNESPSSEMDIESDTEIEVEGGNDDEDEIKPVVIDGTGPQDDPVSVEPPARISKGRSKASPKTNTEDLPAANEEHTTDHETEVQLPKEQVPNVDRKGDVKMENPQLGAAEETPSSAASSIILILIVAVVVVGSALIGFRYYKSRKATYSPVNGVARENPTEGKELREIVVAKHESQPLMEPKHTDLQFEEVNDNDDTAKDATNEDQPKEEEHPHNGDVETNNDAGQEEKKDDV